MHDSAPASPPLAYRLCPRCARAVPATSGERYCANDGTRLMDACPQCRAPITSPYARFCVRCGTDLTPPAQRAEASPSQG
ncbi:zinc ribbon domain-containing protein [Deinococcus frigens]|uniref:zinc ribbon domain-containing protein n=1 Tax=Deinococcus frigens TaxID=249403 RepID=UPI000A000C20|nr:zinc ribbon domain-containing protein [Deinococcus frigens]